METPANRISTFWFEKYGYLCVKNVQWEQRDSDSAELYLQDGDGLREVVLLHGGGGVQGGQWMVKLLQVRVAVSPVVQVVAQAGYQQTLFLQKKEKEGQVWQSRSCITFILNLIWRTANL